MKKNTIRAFTLVEMLIVIVIIGILIAALMPRMSAAQGRARDVARKTDLSQIQTVLISYMGDHGKLFNQYAFCPMTAVGPSGDFFIKALREEGYNGSAKDPQEGSTIEGLTHTDLPQYGGQNRTKGNYRFKIMNRNGVKDAGFVLVTHVEVPGSANYVMKDGESKLLDSTPSTEGRYEDTADIKLCKDIRQANNGENAVVDTENCVYETDNQLVYVVVY